MVSENDLLLLLLLLRSVLSCWHAGRVGNRDAVFSLVMLRGFVSELGNCAQGFNQNAASSPASSAHALDLNSAKACICHLHGALLLLLLRDLRVLPRLPLLLLQLGRAPAPEDGPDADGDRLRLFYLPSDDDDSVSVACFL
ncbi:unnamed protein product [Miscanthus lutarioriparius]|uniref:Secreted protein n=1 Tax=Miscanthus lutarioriparius TaxID=422564 RepID=A0A811S8D7_9POAL|nr:unnamed protein product [Miscanthus lutarioriparius]